jgi:hypothetical protein
MVGIICPPPVGIGLTDLPNIGGVSGPPGPPVPAPLVCIEKSTLGKAGILDFREKNIAAGAQRS